MWSSLICDRHNPWTFHYTTFFSTKFSLAHKTMKAEGCSIQEHPDIIRGSWKLRGDMIAWAWSMQFHCPLNLPPFTPYLKKKTIIHVLPWQISNHQTKGLTPLGKYDQDNLFEPGLRSQIILNFRLEFFQRIGHNMLPIFCKAS